MKNINLVIILITSIFISSCVQKSSNKTVIVRLNTEGIGDIQSVGIRGSEKPLSWKNDLELKPIIKDTLYEATFALVTGYKFTETKFTINGQLEFNDKPNRKIIFADKDTTIYEAKFNVVK